MSNSELDVLVVGDNADQPKVERLNNEVFIQAGNYCVAVDHINSSEGGQEISIPQGETLLIASLKMAHDQIHSVVVKPHPRHYSGGRNPNYYHFLFEDFCDLFKVISAQDGNDVRQQEMLGIQEIANEKQKYLFEVQSNPTAMMQIVMDIYSRRIEHKETPTFVAVDGTVNAVDVIEAGINQNTIDQLRQASTQTQDLMRIQADWMMEKQKELQSILNRILPYSSELASAQRASMEELNRDIEKRQSGIETLELYLGKDVDVYKIQEGESADPSIKLTVMQERLFADVELSLFLEEATQFDYEKRHILWDALRQNPAFVQQVFPTERCVVLMRSNYKAKEYGNSFTNYQRNQDNRAVFLLVRDGENISALFSPISTHLSASRLFPAKEQIERHLYCSRKKININIDDLEYSEKMDAIEQEILHFKRFLLLIAGLDHREKLFGEFYPVNETMNFFFPEFQEKYFNFIHDSDGEGMLPTQEEKRPTVGAYFAKANKRITRGSRVFVNTRTLTSEENAPSCYSVRNGESSKVYHADEDYMMLTVQKDSNGFFVKIPVHKGWREEGRRFNARAALPRNADARELLCLDGLYVEDIEFYINSRLHRREFSTYIDLFKQVKGYINDQYTGYQSTIDYLNEAVTHIKDSELKTDKLKSNAVYETLGTWFSENDGYPLLDPNSDNKEVYENLLLQLNFRASPSFRNKYVQFAEKALESLGGLQPLKLAVGSDGKFWLYTTLLDDGRLNALDKNIFVLRHPLNISAKGRVTTKAPKEILIDQYETEEYVIHKWDEGVSFEDDYTTDRHKILFRNYQEKQTVLDFLDAAPAYLKSFYTGEFTIEQARNLYDAHHKNTVREQREYKYGAITARLRLPLFAFNNTVYVLAPQDSDELIHYLNDKFDLEDYADEKYGIYYAPTGSVSTNYSRKVNLLAHSLRSYESNHLGNIYKPQFTFTDMFNYDFNYQRVDDRGVGDSKVEGHGLLSYAMRNLEKEILGSRSYFSREKLPDTALGYIRSESIYSKFPLEHILNWREFSFDKAVNNPLLKSEYTPMKVDLLFKAFSEEGRGNTLCSSLMVVVEPYDSKEGRNLCEKKFDALKEKYDTKHPYGAGRGIDLIYSFKEAEKLALSFHEQRQKAFFSDEEKLKELVKQSGFTGVLSEMNLIHENNGVFVFETTKEYPKVG